MAERRGDQPAPESEHPPIVAANVDLTPVQERWGEFVRHVTRSRCPVCSGRAGWCEEAKGLYQEWQEADADASSQLRGTL